MFPSLVLDNRVYSQHPDGKCLLVTATDSGWILYLFLGEGFFSERRALQKLQGLRLILPKNMISTQLACAGGHKIWMLLQCRVRLEEAAANGLASVRGVRKQVYKGPRTSWGLLLEFETQCLKPQARVGIERLGRYGKDFGNLACRLRGLLNLRETHIGSRIASDLKLGTRFVCTDGCDIP